MYFRLLLAPDEEDGVLDYIYIYIYIIKDPRPELCMANLGGVRRYIILRHIMLYHSMIV